MNVFEVMNEDVEVVEAGIDVDVEENLSYYELDEVDFSDQWNIRRPDKYEERVDRKMQELLTDLYIRTPLEVAQVLDADEALRGVKGFIRHRALCRIRDEKPEIYSEYFEGKVPYTLVLCTEEQRERLMLDHGSEELLDEYELLLAVQKFLKRGYTQKKIAVILSPLFYQLADIKSKREYNTRIRTFHETGHFEKAYELGEIQLAYWRRRIQYYKRIIEGGPLCIQAFKDSVDGKRPRITQKQAEQIQEAVGDTLKMQELIETKESEKNPASRGMGRAKLVQYRKICHSTYIQKILDVILGELAQEALEPIEEELMKIEAAQKDGNFWEKLNNV